MGTERGGRLRRGLVATSGRRVLVATVTAALLAAGALAVLLGGAGGGSSVGSSSAGGTGKVERRTLAERLTADGTIGYAGEVTVLARLAGTVTELPGVGERIERGEQLYALDGEPVLLMYGEVPAYRELAEGVDDGADVEQLEGNLAALGYEPGTVDGEFTSTTASAVGAWQEDVGLEATGELELGRVAFLPGPRRVIAVEATLGEAIGSGGVPVLKTSSTRRVVSVELDPDRQSVARRGQRVEVLLPGGEEARGEVRRIAVTEASGPEAPGEEPEPTLEITVSLIGGTKMPALEGAAVSVLFTQNVREGVLSVPLTALLAIGGERFAVVAIEGTAQRRIVVTPGLAADGYVEVEGKGLRAGMTVETGR